VRFRLLEIIYAVLVVGGGLVALGADRLGMGTLKTAGITAVFLGVLAFGLDMILQRRAEISTRYSSSINPAFHVFRGVAAVAWGIVFVLAGLLFSGLGYVVLTGRNVEAFIGQYEGPLIVAAGLMLTAYGVGSAARATYRYRDTEEPVRRLADRITSMVFAIPLGVLILSWGMLKTLAPATADGLAAGVKRSLLGWIEATFK
jgi:hypothetical protein